MKKHLPNARKMVERRTARRYNLSLPIIIRVVVQGNAGLQTGKTPDISIKGAFFTINQDLSTGAELNLTITFPSKLTGGTETCIRTKGKIVRLDKPATNGDQPTGVVAAIERYEIVRNKRPSRR